MVIYVVKRTEGRRFVWLKWCNGNGECGSKRRNEWLEMEGFRLFCLAAGRE